ncbi:MAG TPA: DUF6072 family protein [Blastocatellia bacterium]|nr:DUF6072 family protein [Blastocatellia bacterium]
MSNGTKASTGVKTGIDFASELIVPGGSNLVEGNLKEGVIHVVLGLVAKSMFGLPGLIAVSANSFTKATTGRHLHEHLGIGAGPHTPVAPVEKTSGVRARPTPQALPGAATKRSPAPRRKKIT